MLVIFKCLYSWAGYRKIHKNWTKIHHYQIHKTKNHRSTSVTFHFPFYDPLRKPTCMEQQAHHIHIGPIQPRMLSQNTQKQMLEKKRKSRRRTSTLQHFLHTFFPFPYSSAVSKPRGYNFLLLMKFQFLPSRCFWTHITFLTSSRPGGWRRAQNTPQLTWVLRKKPLSLTCFQFFAFQEKVNFLFTASTPLASLSIISTPQLFLSQAIKCKQITIKEVHLF